MDPQDKQWYDPLSASTIKLENSTCKVNATPFTLKELIPEPDYISIKCKKFEPDYNESDLKKKKVSFNMNLGPV